MSRNEFEAPTNLPRLTVGHRIQLVFTRQFDQLSPFLDVTADFVIQFVVR